MADRKTTNKIVVHCTASRYANVDAKVICAEHKARGWVKGGYHAIILPDGTIQDGNEFPQYLRKENEIGAHVEGHNSDSIAISWVGGYTKEYPITQKQAESLFNWLVEKLKKYDLMVEDIYGHNEFPNVHKACPCLDMDVIRATVRDMVKGKVSIAEEADPDENTIIDVPKNHWAYDDIMWGLREAKIFEGTEVNSATNQTVFEPDAPMTRAQMAVILRRYDNYQGQKSN